MDIIMQNQLNKQNQDAQYLISFIFAHYDRVKIKDGKIFLDSQKLNVMKCQNSKKKKFLSYHHKIINFF